jgi:hypothetical protein
MDNMAYLPDEIVLRILNYVYTGSIRDILRFSLVNRQFQRLTNGERLQHFEPCTDLDLCNPCAFAWLMEVQDLERSGVIRPSHEVARYWKGQLKNEH